MIKLPNWLFFSNQFHSIVNDRELNFNDCKLRIKQLANYVYDYFSSNELIE